MNQRKETRSDFTVPLELVDTRTHEPLGRLVNISDHGFMLSTHSPVPEGRELECSILISSGGESGDDRHRIPLTAISVWEAEGTSAYQFWNGFRIIAIRSCDLQLLKSLE